MKLQEGTQFNDLVFLGNSEQECTDYPIKSFFLPAYKVSLNQSIDQWYLDRDHQYVSLDSGSYLESLIIEMINVNNGYVVTSYPHERITRNTTI